MSHRLKLNAVHFSNSLEAEKALLETSQETLESECRSAVISSTRGIGGAVNRKGMETNDRQPDSYAVVKEEPLGCIEEGQGHDLYDAGSGHPRPHHLCLDIYADTFHVKLLLCTAAVSTLSVMPHAWVYMWLSIHL